MKLFIKWVALGLAFALASPATAADESKDSTAGRVRNFSTLLQYCALRTIEVAESWCLELSWGLRKFSPI